MKRKETSEQLTTSLLPLIQGLGFRVADISARRAKGIFEVHLVLAKPGGITLDDCARVHTTVLPKLEMEYPESEVRLEVASPGLNRVIKWADEFSAYTGMAVTVLPEDSDSWIRGTLSGIAEGKITLKTDTGNIHYDIQGIRKAKLESMGEAEK